LAWLFQKRGAGDAARVSCAGGKSLSKKDKREMLKKGNQCFTRKRERQNPCSCRRISSLPIKREKRSRSKKKGDNAGRKRAGGGRGRKRRWENASHHIVFQAKRSASDIIGREDEVRHIRDLKKPIPILIGKEKQNKRARERL